MEKHHRGAREKKRITTRILFTQLDNLFEEFDNFEGPHYNFARRLWLLNLLADLRPAFRNFDGSLNANGALLEEYGRLYETLAKLLKQQFDREIEANVDKKIFSDLDKWAYYRLLQILNRKNEDK